MDQKILKIYEEKKKKNKEASKELKQRLKKEL